MRVLVVVGVAAKLCALTKRLGDCIDFVPFGMQEPDGVVPSKVWQYTAFEQKNLKVILAPQRAAPGLIASKTLVHDQHVSEKCARNDPFRVGNVQTRARSKAWFVDLPTRLSVQVPLSELSLV